MVCMISNWNFSYFCHSTEVRLSQIVYYWWNNSFFFCISITNITLFLKNALQTEDLCIGYPFAWNVFPHISIWQNPLPLLSLSSNILTRRSTVTLLKIALWTCSIFFQAKHPSLPHLEIIQLIFTMGLSLVIIICKLLILYMHYLLSLYSRRKK